jgi:DNA topoisomerase I
LPGLGRKAIPDGTLFYQWWQKSVMPATSALTHRDFLLIDKDYEAAASAANLVYVSDQDAGIARIKKGKGFVYLYHGQPAEGPDLERIKKLVIPPAWTNVWICKSASGHIQATGFDVSGRKQYRYHHQWATLQQETKFHRMYEFGKMLPRMRRKIQHDLAQLGFPEQKVLAMVVSLMERTYIRVGNDGYEKLYGSYGLTTMKNRHVSIQGSRIIFSFKGKKGVYHKITLRNKKLARIVKQCKAIPGSELFQYYDATGDLHKVDSGQVNQYLKDGMARDFTTKDFRTWAGTLMMLRLLKTASPCDSLAAYKKNVNEALKSISKKLGNTVTVCKKYYVHPELINLYQQDQLSRFFENGADKKETLSGLNGEEQLLMQILKTIHRHQARPKLTEKLLRASIKKASKKARKRALAA